MPCVAEARNEIVFIYMKLSAHFLKDDSSIRVTIITREGGSMNDQK